MPHDLRSVPHGNQSRRPGSAIAEDFRSRVIELARGKYADVNDKRLQEKLALAEGLTLSRSAGRRISVQRWQPPRLAGKRLTYLTLLGAVDDSTGKVLAAHLKYDLECSAGYLRLFRSLVESVGFAWAI